jgi:mercuric ion binding protein
MKKLILISLLTGSFAYAKKPAVPASPLPAPQASTTTAQPQEIKVGVKGMVCAFCAQGIEKKFKSQPEVASVDVSLENKYVKLKFKEGKSLPKDKITEILKDAGYDAVYSE